MNLRRYLYIAVFCVFTLGLISTNANAQRQRIVNNAQEDSPQTTQPLVVKQTSSRPTTPPPTITRPTLTNNIVVVNSSQPQPPLIKKTGSSNPADIKAPTTTKSHFLYSAVSTSMMMNSIKSKLGIPYLYGSTGPNRYDCSGFVWAVFNDAGFSFERSSARTFWNEFEPVSGDDRFKFGTLVFFNKLGHVGIVVDENGFYHASSSKGITYSKFEGYWGKRIVGYRRIPLSYMRNLAQPQLIEVGK
jgi:cell wall-associated NlpC family hydrolase